LGASEVAVKPIQCAAVVFVVALLGSVESSSQDAGVIAFEGVTVIPMDRERTLPAQTVIVRDGQIVELGPAAEVNLPPGATRIDGDTRFLLPTLSEMHAHLSTNYVAPYAAGRVGTAEQAMERVLLMYVLNGVGTIRNMTGSPVHLELRDRAARGELISPTIYTSGPPFSGGAAMTAQAAVEMVGAQQAAGYDFIKTYPGTPAVEVFNAMATAAREAGMPIAGHVPSTIGLNGALAARFQTIDHLDGYLQAAVGPEAPRPTLWAENVVRYVDTSRFAQLAAQTKAAGTWMVPTQSLLEAQFSPETLAVLLRRPEMVYVSPQLRDQWTRMKAGTDRQYSPNQRSQFLALRRQLIQVLYEAGVGFLLGSDAPQAWNVPGFSIHRELAALVASGLTPYEALATGTRDVAVFTGTLQRTGTIEVGKRADLLLLDANPLHDITNSSRIAGVMLGGRWLPRSEIEQMLNE
jgi:imidazolonepropionase-like amidohydrolase